MYAGKLPFWRFISKDYFLSTLDFVGITEPEGTTTSLLFLGFLVSLLLLI